VDVAGSGENGFQRMTVTERMVGYNKGRPRLSIAQYFDLILTLAHKEVKVRYKNNALGYLWSLANPLASALVFYFAMQVVFKSTIPDYPLFLIIGLFSWQWFNNYLIGACNVFLANGSLIKKSVFPRSVLPIALDIQDAFHFVMSIPITICFMLFYGIPIGSSILTGALLLIPAQFLLLLGLGLAASSINLFFRDMERILMIVLNMMMYLSPVLFSVDRVPAPYNEWMAYNPVTPLIEAWRGVFLSNELQWGNIGLAYLYAAIALSAGILVYRRLVHGFAELI
jgi:lipopolysaccharide transport system permease protein